MLFFSSLDEKYLGSFDLHGPCSIMVRSKAASPMSPGKCPRWVGKSFSRLTYLTFSLYRYSDYSQGYFKRRLAKYFHLLFCDVQSNPLGSLKYVEIRLVFFLASFFSFRLEAPDGYLRFISLRPLIFTLPIHLTKISYMILNQQPTHNWL